MSAQPPSQQALLLERYKENADQARHHETLRERSTAMVAQTVGVMLGLLGFKDGAIAHSRPAAIIALFIIVLGAWGVFSAVTFEARARRSRDRIDGFLAQLDPNFLPKAKHHTLNYVWIVFHSVIMCLGVVVLALVYCRG